MNALLQRLDSGRHFLGPVGLIGLILILAGPVFHAVVVQPEIRRAEGVEQAVIAAAAQPARVKEIEAPDEAEQLAQFYGQFPRASELSALIEKLHGLARENGVTLRLGEYKLDRSAKGMLWRYEILLPVEAGYPELRRFIDAAQSEIATLGLHEIAFKREAVADKAVKTQLRFVLYVLREAS